MEAEIMTLRDRLGGGNAINAGSPVGGQRAGGADNRAYQQLKHTIHQTLLDRIDLESLQRLSQDQIREELRILVERVLEEDVVVINDIERKNLTRDIQNEMLGFGPLETLLADPTVSDILVNTYKQVYVERHGAAGADRRHVQRRRAPDEDHRQDRLAGRAGASTNRARWSTRACRTVRA